MATVFIPRETGEHETRVAVTPETIGKLAALGCTVQFERGAGRRAFVSDASLEAAGGRPVEASAGYGAADLVLKVQPLTPAEAAQVRQGAAVVSFLVPTNAEESVAAMEQRGLRVFSMNLVPRITRAQKMDALSSQANVAGYKAALLAAEALPRYFPLLMTAAGTIKPAVVVVMGAGVAGLQAIATCRRLGARVWASDVRLAAKEQVASVGGRFIDVPGMEDLEDERGYAKPPTPEFLARQQKIVGDKVAEADAVITTALIPGRKAPMLVPAAVVARMRAGSVIVDLAASAGGNCELSVAGQTVEQDGVTIIGARDLATSVPFHASELYARNLAAFTELLVRDGAVVPDFEDEILAGALVGEPPTPAAPAASEESA